MSKKTIFKTLALAMMMPAMLLTTACSSEDDLVNNTAENTVTSKGYALPVTVNVTRGDGATRAEYNESTKKLSFSAGDKLFVKGSATGAGDFAGTLTWQSEGTFSGTIYTENSYSGTADALFTAANEVTATLLPNGYDANGSNSFLFVLDNNTPDIAYDDTVIADGSHAFVASETAKATGVEQLSFERTYTYSSGFALAPVCAILNFTISGLEAGEKTVTLNVVKGTDYTVTGSVTPNASGVATFAIGVPVGANIKDMENNLTVGTHNFTLPSSTEFAAGKIYNITRNVIPGALVGKFSVSSTDKVYFSKGNLQYTKSTGIWSFMDHQYSTVETTSQAIGDNYASQDVVSLFGWGTSGWNNGNTYYQPYNTTFSSSGYGPKNGSTYTYDLTGDYANADWGHYNAISNGGNTAGTWRTLTKDEWTYLFNTRSASTVNGTADARYAKAYLFGTTHGVIIFPDVYTHPAGVTAPTGINATGSTSWDGNRYTATDWAKMEAAGCVFLPAAGRRDGTTIYNVNDYVRYWTSTYSTSGLAYLVDISNTSMKPVNDFSKAFGYAVRLVHDAN